MRNSDIDFNRVCARLLSSLWKSTRGELGKSMSRSSLSLPAFASLTLAHDEANFHGSSLSRQRGRAAHIRAQASGERFWIAKSESGREPAPWATKREMTRDRSNGANVWWEYNVSRCICIHIHIHRRENMGEMERNRNTEEGKNNGRETGFCGNKGGRRWNGSRIRGISIASRSQTSPFAPHNGESTTAAAAVATTAACGQDLITRTVRRLG